MFLRFFLRSINLWVPNWCYISLPFRFETYDTNAHQPSRLGKRVRVAATNILNVNVSAANLETLVGSILSWRRQLELEQKAAKLNEVLILSSFFSIKKILLMLY